MNLQAIANALRNKSPQTSGQMGRRQLYGGGTGSPSLNQAAMGLSTVPVLGDIAGLAADANMYANEPESRNWMNYGMSAAGILPFVPAAAVVKGIGKNDEAPSSSLNMDNAARMQRARDMGFDTENVYYHGTSADFDEFSPEFIGSQTATPSSFPQGYYFSPDPNVAGRYGDESGANVIPVFLKKEQPITGSFQDIKQFNQGVGDSVLTKNVAVVRNPNQVRSINAAFDPAKRESGNLLAGVGGLGLSGLLAAQLRQPEQDEGIK